MRSDLKAQANQTSQETPLGKLTREFCATIQGPTKNFFTKTTGFKTNPESGKIITVEKSFFRQAFIAQSLEFPKISLHVSAFHILKRNGDD